MDKHGMMKLIDVLKKEAITERGAKTIVDRKLLAEQEEAMETLRKMGPDANAATPQLISLAKHESILLSIPATQALGAIASPKDEVREALVSVVTTGKPQARFWALNALAVMGKKAKAAVPVYLSVMTDPNEVDALRARAIAALNESRVDLGEYVPQLVEVVLNASPDVAAMAALSLWDVEGLKSKLSTDTVVRVLLRKSESGRYYDYVSNLAWMVDPNGEVIPAELAEIARTQMAQQDKALEWLARWDWSRRGLEEYESLLEDPNAHVRAGAIRALASVDCIRSEVKMVILDMTVKDASERVRKQARTMLRQLAPQGPKFMSAMKRLLCSKKVERRLLALELLKVNSGVLTSKNRVLLLIKAMADENPKVRAQAAGVSGGYSDYGKQLLPTLEPLVRDESKLVASEASSAIKRLKNLDRVGR